MGMFRSAARPRRVTKRTTLIARLAREPFAQFLFIGALIFAGSQCIQASQKQARQTIVIDGDVVKRQIMRPDVGIEIVNSGSQQMNRHPILIEIV